MWRRSGRPAVDLFPPWRIGDGFGQGEAFVKIVYGGDHDWFPHRLQPCRSFRAKSSIFGNCGYIFSIISYTTSGLRLCSSRGERITDEGRASAAGAGIFPLVATSNSSNRHRRPVSPGVDGLGQNPTSRAGRDTGRVRAFFGRWSEK